MKKFWQRFLNAAKLYLTLPELRLFWIFLLIAAAVFGLNTALLSGIWALVISGFFVATAVVFFINSLRLAKTNLEIKVERYRLNSIINNLKDGVIAYDSNFRILIFNRAAEEIFDVSASELVGKYFDPSFVQKPRYRILAQAMFPSLAPVVVNLSPPEAPIQVVDISFEQGDLDLRVSTSRILDSGSRLLGFFKVISDRTREKKLIQAKSEFITIAAHQLRTPLTGINWALENLAKAKLPAGETQTVKEGLAASERLLKIVNDLLDVAKIEEGRFGYEFQDFDLIAFVDETLAAVAALAAQYGIKVYFDRPAERQIMVRADPTRLRLAFSNLVDNAIKYNVRDGEVAVKLEKLKERPFVQVSVRDTGIGIPAEELGRLFTKFYRGSNVKEVATTGSGLGLYITQNIIKRHGGEILAESTPGRGTIIYFTLPIDPKLIPSKEIIYGEQ